MVTSNKPTHCTCGASQGTATRSIGCNCDYTCTMYAEDYIFVTIAQPSTATATAITYGLPKNPQTPDVFEEFYDKIHRRQMREERRYEFRSSVGRVSQNSCQKVKVNRRLWESLPQSKKILPRTLHRAKMLSRIKEN